MTEFQEYPKMLNGPDGQIAVVDSRDDEDAQLAEWGIGDEPAPDVPVRRGPGRPRKNQG